MRGTRKVRHLRKLGRAIRMRRLQGRRVSEYNIKCSGSARLFSLLRRRRPLKIVNAELPTFQLPHTVRVVVADGSQTEQKLVPYEEDDDAILTQVPAEQFLSYAGPLDLSIAQMKLDSHQVVIPIFAREFFSVRKCGKEESTIEAVNLWFYKGERMSTWHYDGHDNLLFMLQGRKEIGLLPPSCKDIAPKDVFNTNSNHFQQQRSSLNLQESCVRCILREGECLFIPRGWWHEVRSYGEPSIAINVWGNSMSRVVAEEEQEMLLRHLLLSVSEKLCAGVDDWGDMPEQIREQYRRAQFLVHLKSLC